MSSHAEGGHGTPKFYWMIGIILAVLTGFEIAAFYVKPPFEIEILLTLSAVKFFLVTGFFMHLKFDNRVFTFVFVAGLVLAVFMVSALMLLYHVVPSTTPAQFMNV